MWEWPNYIYLDNADHQGSLLAAFTWIGISVTMVTWHATHLVSAAIAIFFETVKGSLSITCKWVMGLPVIPLTMTGKRQTSNPLFYFVLLNILVTRKKNRKPQWYTDTDMKKHNWNIFALVAVDLKGQRNPDASVKKRDEQSCCWRAFRWRRPRWEAASPPSGKDGSKHREAGDKTVS